MSLAPRPAMLAGREKLLADLHVYLSQGTGNGPRIVALYGLGGAGKTSIAVEYAHRHLAEVGMAWQLAAEDPTVLATGFSELAAQLGAQDVLIQRDPVASVHRVLAAYPARWLLVFDNAPDRASVERFLPPAGGGRVLVTTQNQDWPPGQVLEVPVLDIEVAASFLINRTGDPDRRAARELALKLGGLPLALEQAGAYIQATGESFAGYLASFRHRRADMLGRGNPIGYPRTVATTWALAFERLQGAESKAVGLLRLLAYCAPEAVPLRLLLKSSRGLAKAFAQEVAPVLVPLLEDQLAAGDAIAALRRYSLVTLAGDGAVSMHRLVQAVTADQMPPELATAWRDAAAAMIEAALPEGQRQPEVWPLYALLLPHALATLAAESVGTRRVANYLGYSGSYAAAQDLSSRMFKARVKTNGPEHPDTLAARADLAHWTGEAGNPAGARDQYAELLPVAERVLGPEHPDTLAADADLAHWTGEAGNPAGARDQYAELLPVAERVLGPEHPDTLAARGSLARWTGEAGNPAGARDQYAELLPVRERILGAEHPDSVDRSRSLARWTGEAGNPAGARDQYAGLLPVRERVLGAEHPDTLAARGSLARWTGEAGNPAGARDQYAGLLPVRERVLGPEHPDTLAARANLAYRTGEAGNPAGARDQYAGLLSMDERVLGPEHPATLAARAGLARWTGEAGNPAGAHDQYAGLLPVIERVLGAEHPATLAARANLAYWTETGKGDYGPSVGWSPGNFVDISIMLLLVPNCQIGARNPLGLSCRADVVSGRDCNIARCSRTRRS